MVHAMDVTVQIEQLTDQLIRMLVLMRVLGNIGKQSSMVK